ncbi:cephalosporin hydroxylase family protein [Pseudomonas sp.]|uniref:cephalosporin hydroxylase family protein n=1 Tax=Pseudomonas sp. TaxID=306 RepID=UPI002736CB2E|nr:cephalosporin hydroxylase family protein [Pseudomonas sp.]MDP3814382.1 cephalosporin hydroxylase family protein [Pseudomonas sp.]
MAKQDYDAVHQAFRVECEENARGAGQDQALQEKSIDWLVHSCRHKYSYNFTWLGRPIIQYPQDIVALQELVWTVKPDLIIETGIAHGGSLILNASLLALLDLCEGRVEAPRQVLGVDIEIRAHNRAAIEQHPLGSRITMLEGSSIDDALLEQVRRAAAKAQRVMVILDSNHTHDHVLQELQHYSPLVTPGSYCVVFDTVVEHMPAEFFPDRPWGPGNNPKTAVHAFLQSPAGEPFEIDTAIQNKLLITVAPDGFLKRRG